MAGWRSQRGPMPAVALVAAGQDTRDRRASVWALCKSRRAGRLGEPFLFRSMLLTSHGACASFTTNADLWPFDAQRGTLQQQLGTSIAWLLRNSYRLQRGLGACESAGMPRHLPRWVSIRCSDIDGD